MTLPGLPPRGFDDFGAPPYQTASVLTDPAEVYNRLRGFASLDGQGRVLILDTFNNGMAAWFAGFTGAGIAPVTVTSPAVFVAPTAVEFNPGTVANDTSRLGRLQFLGQTSRLGIEAAFSNPGIPATDPVLELDLSYNYNGQNRDALVRYTPSSALWEVEVGGVFQTVTTRQISNTYAQVKLVADFKLGQYIRLVVGENNFPLDGLALTNTSGSLVGYANYLVIVVSIGAGTGKARVGYVIITRDEP